MESCISIPSQISLNDFVKKKKELQNWTARSEFPLKCPDNFYVYNYEDLRKMSLSVYIMKWNYLSVLDGLLQLLAVSFNKNKYISGQIVSKSTFLPMVYVLPKNS